ncbi:MAG: hypothetical protein J5851_03845 [Oscillospiraceae bacterium]|nr:hypothetical protein [Oscillospiraceae bacterium]
MKTLAELMQEIEGSEVLQKELDAISGSENLAAFLKQHDCDATVEEFLAVEGEGALSDEDAEAVAGGMNPSSGVMRQRLNTLRQKMLQGKTVKVTQPVLAAPVTVEPEEEEPVLGTPVTVEPGLDPDVQAIIDANKKLLLGQ